MEVMHLQLCFTICLSPTLLQWQQPQQPLVHLMPTRVQLVHLLLQRHHLVLHNINSQQEKILEIKAVDFK